MRAQVWCQIMKPDLAVLKFRLPWGGGKSSYLPGRIFVQAFAPCTSTETRLLVRKEDCDEEQGYDHVEYEEKLMYHNTVRPQFV